MTMMAFVVFLFAAVAAGKDYIDNRRQGSLVIFAVCAAVVIFIIEKSTQ